MRFGEIKSPSRDRGKFFGKSGLRIPMKLVVHGKGIDDVTLSLVDFVAMATTASASRPATIAPRRRHPITVLAEL